MVSPEVPIDKQIEACAFLLNNVVRDQSEKDLDLLDVTLVMQNYRLLYRSGWTHETRKFKDLIDSQVKKKFPYIWGRVNGDNGQGQVSASATSTEQETKLAVTQAQAQTQPGEVRKVDTNPNTSTTTTTSTTTQRDTKTDAEIVKAS